jgi:hypothetical protein
MAQDQGKFEWGISGSSGWQNVSQKRTKPCYHNSDYVQPTVVASPGEYMMDATGKKKITLKGLAEIKIGKRMIAAKVMCFDVVKREVKVKVDDPEFNQFITVPAHNVYMIRKEYERLYSSED